MNMTKVEFASLLAYAPRGDSEKHKQSKALMLILKGSVQNTGAD